MSASYIGRCERLFCVLPAERTVHCPLYGRELAVCQECYDEKTGETEIDEDSKRYQYGRIFDRSITEVDR